MRASLITLIAIMSTTSFSQTKQANAKSTINYLGKTITVYTTADSSDLRLSVTDNVIFKELIQPTEGEVSVFVDPTKTFQTFLGIGAALTDASAETFAKLPPAKQEEFLQAYFNKEKGI